MTQRVLDHGSKLFHRLEAFWDGPKGERSFVLYLAYFFVGYLGLILLNRWGVLPEGLANRVPRQPLKAVELSFTILLVYEVIELCFSFPSSFSNAVAKQFQIFSLILLRNSFKEISHLEHLLVWEEMQGHLPSIGSNAAGALVIFVVVGLFKKVYKKRPLTAGDNDTKNFIQIKEMMGLMLLITFLGLVGVDLYHFLVLHEPGHAFANLYSILVFGDIFMMLVSLHYSSCYHAAFRNSSYALATVILRFALTAPIYVDSLLGVVSAFFVLAVAFAYKKMAPPLFTCVSSTDCETPES